LTRYQRPLLIVNPVSGRGRSLRVVQRVRRELESRGAICAVRVTEGPGDASRWSQRAAADSFDLIVAVGGDGTLQEVIAGQARCERKTPVAVIPLGTANVVAIALSLPWLVRPAVENIVNGRVLPFDVGYLPDHDRHFILMAAIGYPARIIKDSPRRLKRIFGVFIYIWAGLRAALRPNHARVAVEADGQTYHFVANTVLVSNIGKIGDINLKVSPDTSPHDGKFDITIISGRTFWDVLKIIFRMLTWRWPLTRRLRYLQANRLVIRSSPSVPVQADGEMLGNTPLRAEIRPNAVELIVGPRYD